MTRRKTIVLAAALLCLLLTGTAYYLYNKPRPAAADEHTEKRVTAIELFRDFADNEQEANKTYVNKVLEVKGTVVDVQKTKEAYAVLLAGQQAASGGVNCTLSGGQEHNIPQVGQSVLIKGLCTGLLMDVSIVDATIIENK
jgi:hypothetical protein